MLIINLFGAPGAGKSTGAAYVFSQLKAAGVNAELVTEFAKDKVWEGTKAVFENQAYIFGKQYFRISRLEGKVDVVITDSPILLSAFYNDNDHVLGEEFDKLVFKVFDYYNRIDVFVHRVKPYNEAGRFQTEEESDAISKEMLRFLDKFGVDCLHINGASVIDDYPMLLNGEVWPRNANWRYQGLTALHTAIAQSLNTCAVRTNLAYGVSNSYDFLVDKLGFENLTYTDSQQVGNMALGGFEKGVTTEEMSAAFATFVNEGVYTKPRTFIRVEDANGNVVLENEAQSTVAMKNTTAAIINHLLQEAALNGTGYEAQFSGMHIAGKTGSTNSNKDRYFVGYTPYYSCAVWAGYEHNQRIVASGNPCSAVFRKVMSAIHEDLPNKDFFSCSGLTSVSVCADSGMLASENCALDVRGSRVYTALVAADNAPTAVCTMHTAPTYTVNMADSDGNVTTVTGSVLNYQRELIEGHDEIVVEDAFMMLGGWNGFFGDEADDDFNMPDGDHDTTVAGPPDTTDQPSNVDDFIHAG